MKAINQRIIEHLNAANVPVHVEDIRASCQVGNWNTALKHCLELLLAKQIEGQRTSNGWIFWINKEKQNSWRITTNWH